MELAEQRMKGIETWWQISCPTGADMDHVGSKRPAWRRFRLEEGIFKTPPENDERWRTTENGVLTMFAFLQDLDNDIRDALLIQLRNLWTHTSTAIEGNTLTLEETAFVLISSRSGNRDRPEWIVTRCW